MNRQRTLLLGLLEFVPVVLVIAGGSTGRLPELPTVVAITVYGLLLLAGVDGMLRLLDAALWPPLPELRGMQYFLLITFGAFIPGLVLHHLGVFSFRRTGPMIVALGCMWIGVKLPNWVLSHPRLGWLLRAFGRTGVRVVYIGLGLLFPALAFVGNGWPTE